MATATSSAMPTPTVVRTSSISSRTQGPKSSSHRSSSRHHTHDPPVSNQATLVNVARRDHETINVARRPSSRRSSSRDRASEYHPEPTRGHHRDRSRPSSSRNSTDFSGGTTVIANGNSVAGQPAPSTVHSDRPITSGHTAMGRRRTSIATATGTWSLGKTIGQGSMGKVKLAKNIETGEQVCR